MGSFKFSATMGSGVRVTKDEIFVGYISPRGKFIPSNELGKKVILNEDEKKELRNFCNSRMRIRVKA